VTSTLQPRTESGLGTGHSPPGHGVLLKPWSQQAYKRHTSREPPRPAALPSRASGGPAARGHPRQGDRSTMAASLPRTGSASRGREGDPSASPQNGTSQAPQPSFSCRPQPAAETIRRASAPSRPPPVPHGADRNAPAAPRPPTVPQREQLPPALHPAPLLPASPPKAANQDGGERERRRAACRDMGRKDPPGATASTA